MTLRRLVNSALEEELKTIHAFREGDRPSKHYMKTAWKPVFQTWARTFKCLWGPGIDAKEWIPPAYVVWRAGTKTLFLLGA
jgi:hypothetical protein